MARDVIGNFVSSEIRCDDESLDIFRSPPVSYYYDNVEIQEIYPQIPLVPQTSNFTFLISPSEDFISLENIVLETKVKIELSSGEPLPRVNRTGSLTTPAQSLTYSSSQPSSSASVISTISSLSSKPLSSFDSLNRKREKDDRERRRELKRRQLQQQQQQQQRRPTENLMQRKRKRENDDDNDEERERKRERKRRKLEGLHMPRCDSQPDYFHSQAPPPWNHYHAPPQPQPQPNPAPNPEIFLGCGFDQVKV